MSVGILLGIYFSEFFKNIELLLWVIFIGLMIYWLYMMLTQKI